MKYKMKKSFNFFIAIATKKSQVTVLGSCCIASSNPKGPAVSLNGLTAVPFSLMNPLFPYPPFAKPPVRGQ